VHLWISGYNEKYSIEALDLFLIGGVICAILTPWIILVCSLIFKFDPFFFVFEDIFGPYQTRSIVSNFATFVARAVLLSGGFECARLLSLVFFTLIVCVNRLQKGVDVLLKHIGMKSYDDIIVHYAHLQLAYGSIDPLIQDCLSVSISAIFWSLVACAWIVIKGHKIIPLFMYLLISPFSFCTLVLLNALLCVVCRISENCLELVKLCGVEAKVAHFRNLEKASRKRRWILIKIASSLKPIQIAYEPFLKVDRGFVSSVWNNCANRIFDAMLIF